MVRCTDRAVPEKHPVVSPRACVRNQCRTVGTQLFWKIVSSGAIGNALEIRGWDSEYVIFHPVSGDTHLVNHGAQVILQCLRIGTADTNHLVAHLAQHSGCEADDDLRMLTRKTLFDLERLGVIEQHAE